LLIFFPQCFTATLVQIEGEIVESFSDEGQEGPSVSEEDSVSEESPTVPEVHDRLEISSEPLKFYSCNDWELYLKTFRVPTLAECFEGKYHCLDNFDVEVAGNTCQKGVDYFAELGEERFAVPLEPPERSQTSLRGALDSLRKNQANVFYLRRPIEILIDFVEDIVNEKALKARKDIAYYDGCSLLLQILRRQGFCDAPLTILGFKLLKSLAREDENVIEFVRLDACRQVKKLVECFIDDFEIARLGMEIWCNLLRLEPDRSPSRERVLDIGKVN
jgi:hypothetical protein